MKKILILAGGYSKERAISILTAKSVYKELKKIKNYKIKITEPDGSFVKKLRLYKPDLVFNLLHGRYGEDGYIQAILETEKVKYTHSGVLSSSLAIDKELSKKIFIKNKILTPKYLIFCIVGSRRRLLVVAEPWVEPISDGELSKTYTISHPLLFFPLPLFLEHMLALQIQYVV